MYAKLRERSDKGPRPKATFHSYWARNLAVPHFPRKLASHPHCNVTSDLQGSTQVTPPSIAVAVRSLRFCG